MFEKLTGRLNETFKSLTGRGILTEEDVNQALREVRRALLEADVSFRVVKSFIQAVSEQAIGEKVLNSLKPGHQVIKIVHDEIVKLLGGFQEGFEVSGKSPVVLLLMGLQGSGKTTTAARLAYWLLQKRGKRCMLVAADLKRPAAIRQLEILSGQAGASFFKLEGAKSPIAVVEAAIENAKKQFHDVVLIDTAGRQHVDEYMMEELAVIRRTASPEKTILVLDGLSGQDVVNVAKEFESAVGYDGAIITKMDGDSKGGATLSFKAVTGKPILFSGNGEGINGIECFIPERMADRILGMGDIVGLAEKAQSVIDEREKTQLEEKFRKNLMDLDDFARELNRLRKMGSLGDIISMIPGAAKHMNSMPDENSLKRIEAIIQSMTPVERKKPEIIDGSRRKRIARGSGTTVRDVNRLLGEFRTMKSMMKKMKSGKQGIPGLFRQVWR